MRKLTMLLAFMLMGWSAVPALGQPRYVYKRVDVPNAAITGLRGINNHGHVVGYFKVGADPDDFTDVHALLIARGGIEIIDVPGSEGDNRAFGINDAGAVAGSTQLGGLRGFVYEGGVHTLVDFPGSVGTTIRGLNALGNLAGEWDDPAVPDPVRRGFVRIGGTFLSVDVPGATSTRARAISNRGDVSGYYFDPTGAQHAFLLARGRFRTLSFPCEPGESARAAGINSRRQVIGACFPGPAPRITFVYDLIRNTVAPIAVPRALVTLPLGINDRGQVVGEFVDAGGTTRGFIASPRR